MVAKGGFSFILQIERERKIERNTEREKKERERKREEKERGKKGEKVRDG